MHRNLSNNREDFVLKYQVTSQKNCSFH